MDRNTTYRTSARRVVMRRDGSSLTEIVSRKDESGSVYRAASVGTDDRRQGATEILKMLGVGRASVYRILESGEAA